MSRHLTRKSEAQANAEALATRSATYADQHAASWRIAFDRPSHEPKSLRGYVNELRAAYADECPSRMHDGARQRDAGGGPRFASSFAAYLFNGPDATDRRDPGTTEVYYTPLRACLAGMARAQDERTRRRASIAGRVTVGSQSATEAAIAEGVPAWCADIVAADALAMVWRNLSSVRLTAKREDAA